MFEVVSNVGWLGTLGAFLALGLGVIILVFLFSFMRQARDIEQDQNVADNIEPQDLV